MMHWSKLTAIIITAIVLTAACKEDEIKINPCLNGQIDAGETAIDCGGTCGDCPQTEIPTAGFQANGDQITIGTKQLTYNNGWTLSLVTDTITLQLNLGSNPAVGMYPMPAGGSIANVDGVNYPTLASGSYSITSHNTTTEKMSGFFQGKFVRVPGDTLYITNGYFNHLAY
jgi:hypothetical protein